MERGDLLSYRKQAGITQAELAERLGYKANSVAKVERGKAPFSAPMQARFRALLEKAGAAPPDGSAPPGREPGSAAPAQVAAGEVPPVGGDLPPLAEPPPEVDLDGDALLRTTVGGDGRTVTVRNLGHFARIELSLLVFFAGKEIEYAVPTAAGKAEIRTIHQPGLADFVPDGRDAAVIREHAAAMAHAWAEWARTNPRVNWFLSFFILEGGMKGVAAATFPVILTILQNHGVDPVAFFTAPLGGLAGLTGAGGPAAGEPAAEPDGQQIVNPDGGVFAGTEYGFTNADAVDS